MFQIALIILVLPLLSFLVLILGQKRFKPSAGHIALGVIVMCFLLSLYLFFTQWGAAPIFKQIPWFSLNRRIFFTVDIRLDNLTIAMLLLVTFIASLVHLFSLEYMHKEPYYSRYFAYLGLFTFAMLGIVLSDNLLITYFFWELVGFSSYLLIGFWYHKEAAAKAAKKAFLINRIGDTGFLIGIILVWLSFSTFQLSEVEHLLFASNTQDAYSHYYFSFLGFALFCGAMGKSAQFPLQIWLPDAMEGPTPVSALIHAATMVAAGVFLMARVFFLLNISVFVLIAFIGTITAILGALSALIQKDLKKLLAYSTISQLGYMMMGIGVGAYSASLLHLFTHAFFKAGLFLGAGVIIHALHEAAHKQHRSFDAQNMYLMGGLSKRLPFTTLCFSACAFALAGLPLFSGFLSKDAILSGAWAWAAEMSKQGSVIFYLVPIIGFLTAMLTALYVGRMLLIVFVGKYNLDRLHRHLAPCFPHIQEPSLKMRLPLAILATLSLFVFFSWNPFSGEASWLLKGFSTPANYFLGEEIQLKLHQQQEVLHEVSALLSVLMSALGLGLAYWLDIRYRFMKPIVNQYARNMLKWSYYGLSRETFYTLFFMKASLKASENTPYIEQTIINEPLQYLVNLGMRFSRFLAYLDAHLIDYLVMFIAHLQVVVAHLVAWIDRTLIDGGVWLFTYLIGWVGKQARSLQGGQVQSYFVVLILTLCGILFFFFFSI